MACAKTVIHNPRIFNKKLTKVLQYKKIQEQDIQRDRQFKKNSQLIISCKKGYLNHYQNQIYSKYKSLPLISNGWGSNKSRGDTFTFNAYGKNPAYQPKDSKELYPFNNEINFEKLSSIYDDNGHVLENASQLKASDYNNKQEYSDFRSLHPKLKHLLDSLNFSRTTNIQKKSLEILLERRNALITSETGSGKTLAYVLPILNYLLQNLAELENFVSSQEYDPGCRGESRGRTEYPMIVILAPTKELCAQIMDVVRKFADPLLLRTVLHIGGLVVDSHKDQPVWRNSENPAREASPEGSPESGSGESPSGNSRPLILHILVTMPGLLRKLTATTNARRSKNIVKRSQGSAPASQEPTSDSREPNSDVAPTSHDRLRHGTASVRYGLGHVRTMVVDEADTLLDDSFAPDTVGLLRKIMGGVEGRTRTSRRQVVLVGATRPTGLEQTLGWLFPPSQSMPVPGFEGVGGDLSRDQQDPELHTVFSHELTAIQTPKAHHILPHVRQKFIRLRGWDKEAYLVNLLKKHMSLAGKSTDGEHVGTKVQERLPPVTMIFCQETGTVDHLRSVLKSELKGYGFYHLSSSSDSQTADRKSFVPGESVVEGLHSKMDWRVRAHVFDSFFSRPPTPRRDPSTRGWEESLEHGISAAQTAIRYLLTTDLMSRGLDTGRVQLVINYDFPKFISDYIHRVGRVGRLTDPSLLSGSPDGPDSVINLISTKREAKVVQVIEESIRKGKPLFNVNANIKRKIVSLAEEYVMDG